MRLTESNPFKKFTSLKYTNKKPIFLDYDKGDSKAVEELLNKLGQLEDIEDEFGIDLLILFKALNECYVDGHKGQAIIINNKEIAIKYQLSDYSWTSKICKIKDYGKTWALTKEELI
jgi:hypothetical protein